MIEVCEQRLSMLNKGFYSSWCLFHHNNNIKGQFCIQYKDDHYEIWNLQIYGKYRGHKHGQRMLCECLQMFNDMPLELSCLKDNYRALHIYQKFNFTIIKDCGDYYWLRREVK